MHLRFANDEIKHFTTGNLVFENDGKPFEVDDAIGRDLLFQEHALDGTTMTKVFEVAGHGKQSKANREELAEDYPENFPSADALAAAGFTHSEARLLTREQLIEIKGIGPKSADAILEYTQED